MKSYAKSNIIKVFCVVVIFGFIPIQINSQVISTIYSVIGIMFSIALSLIVTFSFSGIKSIDSIKSLRYKIKVLRKKHIVTFSIDTILYLLSTMLKEKKIEQLDFTIKETEIIFNPQLIITVLLVSSIFYYVITFINIQKFNELIFNELNDID